jgi:type VI secretion system secreted protein Hcp
LVRKAGEKLAEYVKIKMELVLIASLSTGGGEDRLTQNTTLNFSKVKLLKQGYPDEGFEGPFQVVRDNPVMQS